MGIINFFKYERHDSCSRANTHDANLFPGLRNVNIIIIRWDIIDKHQKIGDFAARLSVPGGLKFA